MAEHDPSQSSTSGIRRFLARKVATTPTSPAQTSDPPTTPNNTLQVAQGSSTPADQQTNALVHLFAGASHPEQLLQAFAEGMCSLHGELSDMGIRLRTAYDAADWPRYARAMRQLIDKYIRTIDAVDPMTDERTEAERLSDLLRYLIGNALTTLLQNEPHLLEQTQELTAHLRGWRCGQPLDNTEQGLRELSHQISLRANEIGQQNAMLVSVFEMLLENIGELIDDRSWLKGQIQQIRHLISGPLNGSSIEQARTSLREVIYKQGLLKRGIADSKDAVRQMMSTFVTRLDGMAENTNAYHARVTNYSNHLAGATSINDLQKLLQSVLQDTSLIQNQALSARDELVDARIQVEQTSARIAALEKELRDMVEQINEDQLTGALNRRGLDELFTREAARTLRSQNPMCLAVIDLDNFRKINEAHGHAGGDSALCHFVEVARTTMRAI